MKSLAVVSLCCLTFAQTIPAQTATPSQTTPSQQVTPTPAPKPSPAIAPVGTPPPQQSIVNAPAQPPSAPTTPDTLLDGTPVKLRLAENLSSESAKTGQQVSFEVTEDVIVDGVTVITKGASALATVTLAEPKRRMGRGGKLDVNVDSVRLADGEKAQLRAVRENKGGGHVGAMTGAMVGTAIVFFPAAPLFLFMHGKSVEIPKGTEVMAFVQGDMRLDMAKFVAPTGPTPSVPAGAAASVVAAAAPQPSSLTVESSVVGADIEVDGSFVGSTPSTVSVPVGQHTITVKKKGYADWTKTMNVSGSSVHLNAELEQKTGN